MVYVYKNGDTDKIAKIAVGTQTVTGEASKISSNGKTVTIEGKGYKYAYDEVSQDLDNAAEPDNKGNYPIEAGDGVELTLDAYGYIYNFEQTSGKADKYAVVLQTCLLYTSRCV